MIKSDISNIKKAPEEWPEVFKYTEDIKKLRSTISSLSKDWKNIIVVGNGGSITSYDAYYGALQPEMNSETVWTMDPFLLKRVKERFDKKDTVVVAVSKSGNTLGQIESLLYFSDYDVITVTNPSQGTLSSISEKMGWSIIEHPPVGGRFSGGTSSAFVPSILAGIDVEKIQEGIRAGYSELKDQAYSLSRYYFELEQKGYEEVYITIYAAALEGFQNLIVQLMHESVCKQGKGQTFYISMAPESQHHTNQRFLGGKKNVIGTFIKTGLADSGETISVPDKAIDLDYKGEKLGFLNGTPYQKALEAEYLGTKQDADKLGIPNTTIELSRVDEQHVGMMVAFWHLVAYYSSILRDVDPFNQPAVENSKNITLNILKNKI